MSKHTEGPWEVRHIPDYKCHPFYVSPLPHYLGGPKLHGSVGAIAKLPASKFHDQAANARLIAAAPDLLEALQAIEKHMAAIAGQYADQSTVCAIARKAIAKATQA